jgi:integrase
MIMQGKLTESTLKKLSAADKPYEFVDTELKGFLLRIQPSGNKVYYYSYRNPAGSRSRIKVGSTKSLSVAQARDLAKDYSADVQRGKDVQQQKKEERVLAAQIKERTLGKFLENHYAPWALLNLKTGEKTIASIERNFSAFFSTPLNKISLLAIEQWRSQRLKAGKKPATINRDITALRGLLSKAVLWEVVEEHPLRKLKQLKIDNSPKVRYLSDSEEARLTAALEARDKELKAGRERGNKFREERNYPLLPALLDQPYGDRLTPMAILSLKTGMRQGEVFDLRWSDVSIDEALITVRAETNKSNKTRHIPLSPIAKDVVKNWHAQSLDVESSSLMFPGKHGARLDNVKRSWARVLKDAKIEKFRWHDMRHDFASKLVMAGVPLNTVRDLCGHADLSTTLRYAHLAPAHKAEAIAKLG